MRIWHGAVDAVSLHAIPAMNEPVKILLVEDSPDYRKAVGMAFDGSESFRLVQATGTAERALDLLGRVQPGERPDVVLLDLNLPGMSGLDAVPRLLAAAPAVKILVLTQSDKEGDVLQAIASGASGYLLKSSGIKQIKEAIAMVMEGGAPLDAGVAQHILKSLRSKPAADAIDESQMTSRELEILNLLAEGLVKKEIAVRLGISTFTVQAHVRNIYTKLQVPNAPAAVSQGYRKGLLPVERKP